MDNGPPPPLPSGVPDSFAEQIPYNELLDFGGDCQFYVLPPGGEFNLTQQNGTNPFRPDELIIYAVNCNLTQADYIELWRRVNSRFSKVPFRSSLTPLMVVISICTVASWIVVGVMVALRRHTRPWLHIVVLGYACIMINVLYGHLHYFSRIEHMYGHESTDSFIQFFYGTQRAAAIFIVFLGFMLCECHIILTIFTDTNQRFWILCVCIAFLIFENSWWVSGISMGVVYNILTRTVDWRVRVYFYLEILGHLIFFLAYSYRLLSLWKYSFYKKNRALGVICLLTTILPFTAMLTTAIARGCFAWSLPLSMVARALSLVLVWDWYAQTLKIKDKLEKDDTLGRLITEGRVKKELKAKLGHEGGGQGTFASNGFASKVIEKILHPSSIISSMSIWGVGAHESDEQESVRTDADADADTDTHNMRQKWAQTTKPTDSTQHHPVLKHTVKVNNSGGNVLRPRFDKTYSQISTTRTGNRNTDSFISRVATFSTSHSLQAQPQGPSNVDTTLNSDPGPTTDFSELASPSSSSTPPRASLPSSTSGEAAPSTQASPPRDVSDAPPGFIPHPGFRSGDYNNEKQP